ncbi:MAG: hypothetical protein H8D88_01290 [Bacteroidetes bacterium]|nr:hypothetical protein [Bacteroidota bacterium]
MVVRNEKGQYAKGHEGKPKGAKNKITALQKERVEFVLNLLEDTLEEDMENMKPKERVELWASLQEFIRPKLQRMNVDITPPEDKITKITFEVIKGNQS